MINAKELTLGTTDVYHSTVLNEDREFQVSLPPSYYQSTSRRYPVVYVLDGESQFAHTAVDTAFLADDGEIPEVIVIGITSTIRVRDFTQTDWSSAWVGGGGAGNFRKFLSSEFIPHIEQTYRTDGFRILVGHSAGGQFALYCLTVDPHLFQAMLAISPSLNWDNRVPIRSLEEATPKRVDVRNFVYFASSDDSGDALRDDLALATILKDSDDKGIRSVYRPFPDESHSGSPLIGVIDGLRQLFTGYEVPDAVSDRGLAAVENYYDEYSKKVGWHTSVPSQVVNDLAFNALRSGKSDEAFALFNRNIHDDPNSPSAYDSLAEGYQQTGNLAAALVAEQKARELATHFDASNLVYYDQQIARIRRKQAAAASTK
jgi:hypothetical protein